LAVSIDVSLHDNPVMSSANNASICSGESPSSQLTFTALLGGSPPVEDVIFSWKAVNVPSNVSGVVLNDTGTGQLTDVLTNISGVSGVVTFEVTPIEDDLPNPPSCTNTPQTVFITVLPEPVITAAQSKTICSGDAVNYKILLTPAALPATTKFEWSIPDMSAGPIQGSASVVGGVLQSNATHLTDVLTNTTSAQITATYHVTPKEGGCEGEETEVLVLINPEPVGADNTVVAKCSNTPFSVSANNITNGLGATSTYSWVRNALPPGLTVVTAGTGVANIAETLQNLTSGQLSAVYTVTPTSEDGCDGATYEITVPVNPSPVGASITRGAQCSNELFSVSANNITNGLGATSTYAWTRNALPTGLTEVTAGTGSDDIAETLRNLTGAPISATYSVVATSADGCPGNTYTITVPINPEPVGIDATAVAQCSNVGFSISANSITNGLGATSTYAWVRGALSTGLAEVTAGTESGNIAETLENLTSVSIDVIYTITPTSASGCEGETYEITIPINPEPVGADIIRAAECSSDAFSVSADNITNGLGPASIFTWTRNVLPLGLTDSISGDGTGAIEETLKNLTGAAINAEYIVTATTSGCEGETYKVSIPISPQPVGVNTTIERCSGDPVNLDLQTLINNGVISKFRYTVAVEAGAASSEVNAFGIDRNSPNQDPVSNVFTHIANASTADAVVVFTITPISNVANCDGKSFKLKVIVHPQPRGETITTTSCGPVSVNIQAQIANGIPSKFIYEVINDPTNPLTNAFDTDRITPSSDPISFAYNNITEQASTITYKITPFSTMLSPITGLQTDCQGADFFYVVTISPRPVGIDSTYNAICSNVPFSIDPQANVGPPIPEDANGVTITSYSWTATYDAGLTVNGTAAPTGPGNATQGINLTGFLTNKSNSRKFAEFTITPSSGSCVGPNFTIQLPIDPEPVVDRLAWPYTICSDAASLITFGPIGGTVAATDYDVILVSQDAALSADPANDPVGIDKDPDILELHKYTNKTGSILDVVFDVTPNAPNTTAGICVGETFELVLHILPEPVMNPSLANVSVCSDQNSGIELTTDGVAVNAASFYVNSIELNGTNIGGNNLTVGDVTSGNNKTANPAGAINATLNRDYLAGDRFRLKVGGLTNADRTVVYNVTPESGSNCKGDPFNINLLIKPEPVLRPRVQPDTVCSDVQMELLLEAQPTSIAIADFLFVNVNWDTQMIKGVSNVNVGDTLAGPTYTITDTYTNTTNVEREAVYTIVPISVEGCLGDADATTVIEITPAPAVAAGSDKIVCSDAIANIELNDTESSGGFEAQSFKITRPVLPAGLTAVSYTPGTSTDNNVPSQTLEQDKLINTTNDPIDVDYVVQAWTGLGAIGCSNEKIVTLKVEPRIVVTSLDEEASDICSGSNARISLLSTSNPSAGAVTFDFTVAGATPGSNISADGLTNTYEIDQLLDNTTNIPKTATYKVTPHAHSAANGIGCHGAEVMIAITVEPKPKLKSLPASLTICEGVPLAVDFSSVTTPSGSALSPVFFTEMGVDLAGGQIIRNDNNLSLQYNLGTDALNEKLTNLDTVQLTIQYEFLPKFDIATETCEGDPFTFDVTVSPTPKLEPFTIDHQCSAQSFDVDFSSSVREAELASTLTRWTYSYPSGVTNMSGASNGAGTDLSQVVFNKNSDPVVVTYTFNAKSFNCSSNSITVPVTVYPVPKISGVASSKNICNGGSLDLTLGSTVNNSTYVWSVDDEVQPDLSGASDQQTPVSHITNFTFNNSSESLSNYTFEITPLITDAGLPTQILPTGTTINGCYGDTHTLVANIAPPLDGSILTSNETNESFICTGSREFLFMEFKGLPLFEVVYKEGANTISLTRQGAFKPLQVTPLETTVYELVSIKDAFGCAANINKTATVNVNNTDATFSIAGPEESCSPYKVSFEYDQKQGVNYTWKWFDGPDSTTYTAATTVPDMIVKHSFENPAPVGVAKFKVYLETSLADERYPGCSKTTFQQVLVSPNPSVGIFPNTTVICSGETVTLVNSSQGVNEHKWFYRLPGSATEQEVKNSSSVAYELVNNTSDNPITYEIVYVAENGKCPSETSIPIKVYKGVDANFTADVPPFIAGNSTVTFSNTSIPIDENFFKYEWDFDLIADVSSTPSSHTGGEASLAVSYKKPGFYEVMLKATNLQALNDGVECSSTSSQVIHIQVPPLTSAFTVTPLASCFPTKLVVNNQSPGDTFEWRLIGGQGEVATSSLAQPVFEINEPGTYRLSLKASLSSTGQEAVTVEITDIEVYDMPSAFFIAPNETLFVPDTELGLINQSVGANYFEWNFDDGTISNEFEPQHFYQLEGKYFLTLVAGNDHGDKDIDGDGIADGNVVCYDTAVTEIFAKEGGFTRIPNSFTPNPDGPVDGNSGNAFEQNDVFLPVTKGVVEFEMEVYDRWGTLVFKSVDKNFGWNGYDRNNNILPAGVYVFKLTLRLADGQRTTQVGDVTLIR
jgi:gliding motility-associated-like protein